MYQDLRSKIPVKNYRKGVMHNKTGIKKLAKAICLNERETGHSFH